MGLFPLNAVQVRLPILKGGLPSCRFQILAKSLKTEHLEGFGCEIEIFWQASRKNGLYVVLSQVESEIFNSGGNKCSELTDWVFICSPSRVLMCNKMDSGYLWEETVFWPAQD